MQSHTYGGAGISHWASSHCTLDNYLPCQGRLVSEDQVTGKKGSGPGRKEAEGKCFVLIAPTIVTFTQWLSLKLTLNM